MKKPKPPTKESLEHDLRVIRTLAERASRRSGRDSVGETPSGKNFAVDDYLSQVTKMQRLGMAKSDHARITGLPDWYVRKLWRFAGPGMAIPPAEARRATPRHETMAPNESRPIPDDVDDGPHCDNCGQLIDDEVIWDGADIYCEACGGGERAKLEDEAEQFAAASCRITAPLHRFDPAVEYRCTPEEYEAGVRESHTESSVAARNRHECTNYDQLIQLFDRDSLRGQVYYAAVRKRIDELVEGAMLADDDAAAGDAPAADQAEAPPARPKRKRKPSE